MCSASRGIPWKTEQLGGLISSTYASGMAWRNQAGFWRGALAPEEGGEVWDWCLVLGWRSALPPGCLSEGPSQYHYHYHMAGQRRVHTEQHFHRGILLTVVTYSHDVHDCPHNSATEQQPWRAHDSFDKFPLCIPLTLNEPPEYKCVVENVSRLTV